ncbi:3-hydroxyacyl-CoA dehydrogenase family protein [Citricoccus sp. SGAir0253]|uniref:3-hydroxyacyl-CoA dehydrogenase family protein n=1 Tax=Citricoccus sp. SGAir0253 TaxID=2567881 RepID=UPI0010CCEF00|nr:3-hydroxyacyl-CoA dehydrogenase family protein [Citricoccus sp. SGAir0253]QCU77019.1 3-hydroxyacyl-CoA dehydrogenase family protein [Citricoccus sp. SGAir0253]
MSGTTGTTGTTATTGTAGTIEHVLVVGAGAMGRQIAMTAALAGCRTTVQDISADMLGAARAELEAWAEGRVAKGRLDRDAADGALGRLAWSPDLPRAAATADLVIEAATERLPVKTEIFTALGRHAPARAILVTNSSTLGSSKVADVTGRPEKVCNLHFFNPALVMECVEVVRHERTSEDTVETVMAFARRLGKRPVLLSREVPGFIANRLMGAVQREALALAEAGVASLEDIDTAARTALGHPLGPFELMDLVGLDVVAFIAEAIHAETGDEADRPDPAVAALVARGRLGRKSGAGFYDYAGSS